jgi:hypothetical protein
MAPITRTAAPTVPTQPAAAKETFNATDYLKTQLTDGQSANYIKAMGDSYSKSFETKVTAAVSKLGAGATKEQVDKAISSETSTQMVVKGIIDRASSQIMNRIKELSSDTFTE